MSEHLTGSEQLLASVRKLGGGNDTIRQVEEELAKPATLADVIDIQYSRLEADISLAEIMIAIMNEDKTKIQSRTEEFIAQLRLRNKALGKMMGRINPSMGAVNEGLESE